MSITTGAQSLHRRAGLALALVVMAAVVLLGIYQAKDSINGVKRSAALPSQVYELNAVKIVQEYEEKKEPSTRQEGSEPSEELFVPLDRQVERRIAFVRVGQTGGTTIARTFPRLSCRQISSNLLAPHLMEDCLQKYWREDSPLASQLELELHLGDGRPPRDLKDYTTFMFSIRNPLARVISSYSFLHHNNTKHAFARKGHQLENRFYKLCFPTLKHLLRSVEYLSHPEFAVRDRGRDPSEIPTEHSEYCQQMAFAALKGKNPLVGKINAHLRANNQFYYDETLGILPNKEVVAVRMEHMLDDARALDIAMGGQGVFLNEVNYAREIWRSPETPTSEEWVDLCCILWEDLEAYQQIVNHARNLEYPSKLEAMQDVWNTCGVSGRGQNRFKKEDSRTSFGNAKAREGNSQIVLFSWQHWHEVECTSNAWERRRINLSDPPPEELVPNS